MNQRLVGIGVVALIGLAVAMLTTGPRDGGESERRSVGADRLPRVAQSIGVRATEMSRSLRLSDAEQKAVNEAIAKKVQAREALLDKLFDLFTIAVDRQANDAEVEQALDTFVEAHRAFRAEIEQIDRRLIEQISLRSRARLIASGVLDNGLGFMAGKPLSTEGVSRPRFPTGPRGGHAQRDAD